MALASLPGDILQTICCSLTGFDVFYLSHTSSWALRVFSGDSFWNDRVSNGAAVGPSRIWKQRYMRARSLHFISRSPARRSRRQDFSISYAMLERPELPVFWPGSRFQLRNESSESFSFDVWFCIYPDTDKTHAGGIIYGLQTKPVMSPRMSRSESFVMVDTHRDLFCSVLDVNQPVARDMEPMRWYHLALTYDVDLQRQNVYVDGKNAWSTEGELLRDLQRYRHEQIGTGYFTNPLTTRAWVPAVVSEGGSYCFNGLIDEFRVWRSVLPPEAIAGLALGGQLDDFSVLATIKPSHGNRSLWIKTKSVHCTRPAEMRSVVIEHQR